MKSKFVLGLLLIVSMVSCADPGVSSQRLSGNESTLPDDIKGLKVYRVSLGGGEYVKVAVLDNKINSTTYKVGKHEESIIVLNKETSSLIEVKGVLYENDSIVIFKK
jgi:hypothetical protein